MNWVFWALILIAAVVVWFSISGVFNSFGTFIFKIFENTVNEMNKEDNEKDENE